MGTYESVYTARTIPSSRFFRPMSGPSSNLTTSTVISLQDERGKVGDARTGDEEQLVVLGIRLGSFSKSVQFFVCCGGVFFFYLIYGYVQEWIFRVPGLKSFGWYLTLVQFGFYSMFGMIETSLHQDKTRKIPLKTYALLAFLTVSTMGLSNTSLGYLNYPTQVIFKCCKLIPVMIGGILIQGKKYRFIDFTACVCMSAGLIWFTLTDSKVQPEFNHTGILLISLALCADAVIGNVQEKAMKLHRSSNTEVVLYSYGIGFLYIFLGLFMSGGLWKAFEVFAQSPLRNYGLTFVFSVTGYLGVTFVLTLVRTFGALVAVTVTTCRKAVTMVLSFLFFTKPFNTQYVWSGLVVLFGIFLNVYSKNQDKMDVWFSQQFNKCSLRSAARQPRRLHMENV